MKPYRSEPSWVITFAYKTSTSAGSSFIYSTPLSSTVTGESFKYLLKTIEHTAVNNKSTYDIEIHDKIEKQLDQEEMPQQTINMNLSGLSLVSSTSRNNNRNHKYDLFEVNILTNQFLTPHCPQLHLSILWSSLISPWPIGRRQLVYNFQVILKLKSTGPCYFALCSEWNVP